MTERNEELETIELTIKESKKYVDRMESLFKLTKNRDFVRLIDKGYFEEEASRLVLLKADPNMQDVKNQEHINKSIDSIGYFRQYLANVIQLGRMMEKSIEESNEAKNELLIEE